MLLFDVQWVDVTPFLLTKEQPVVLVRRELAHGGQKAWAGASQIGTPGEFWVPTTGLLGPDPAEFSVSTIGDAVRVPMNAYKTAHYALPDLFGLGVQIGMAAVIDLRNHTMDVPKAVRLVIGHQCTVMRPAEESFRCYIGISLQTK